MHLMNTNDIFLLKSWTIVKEGFKNCDPDECVYFFLQVVVSSSYYPEQLRVFVFKRMNLEAGCVPDTINGSVVCPYVSWPRCSCLICVSLCLQRSCSSRWVRAAGRERRSSVWSRSSSCSTPTWPWLVRHMTSFFLYKPLRFRQINISHLRGFNSSIYYLKVVSKLQCYRLSR